jgi:hypothetical protein
LDNPAWIEGVVSGSYRDWLQKQYNWNFKTVNLANEYPHLW